ncbi:MAG TPA: FeoB-associated Cys-rich membrane protein [Clostridium sp.]
MVATIVIGGIILGLMALVIVKQVKKVRSGESGCGCGCSGCSSANACHGIKVQKK